MKNKIINLLFGSITRELLFLFSFFIFIFVFLDVSRDIMSYGISWFILSLMHNPILLIAIPCIIVLFLIGNKFKFLLKRLKIELLAIPLLLIASLYLLPHAITILLLFYFLIARKAKYILTICNGIKIITEGNLEYKIEVRGHDEIAALATSINNMCSEEKASKKLKTELITNVSHDLRTPLTSLIGYLQLAANDKINSEAKDNYIKISLEKSKQLKTLIDDLFEYSKLQSGGIKLERQSINIVELLEQSIGELSLQANKRHIIFKKIFNLNALQLSIDPNKMARVFTNIISNAVKYSLPSSAINISLHDSNKGIIISFENTVDTIFEEDLGKLFNRFYRRNTSIASEADGSGLGLAIAKNIVELHKGKIWIENNSNSFIISIELST